MRPLFLFTATVVLLLSGCDMGPDKPVMTSNQVTPDAETWPVLSEDDAADDPAIYLHATDSSKNYFYATDKQTGFEAYYPYGPRFFVLEFGPINNTDIRYNFPLNDELVDIMAATDRYTNSIKVFRINPDNGMIKRIDSRRILSGLDEVYGFCLYNDLDNNIFYGFITGKNGGVEQWRLYATPEDEVGGEFVRFLNVQTQAEGCVADDELGWFYVAEETVGILKFPAQPDKEAVATVVDDLQNPDLEADIEGLTIYYTADGGGYLIASSQGNNSYAVYDRTGENAYLGSFTITDRVEDGKVVIDGTSDTDGIDVINHSFGGLFPKGVFIAQDGENIDEDGNPGNQNFKMVSWEKIANLFDPPLDIDTTYNIRSR